MFLFWIDNEISKANAHKSEGLCEICNFFWLGYPNLGSQINLEVIYFRLQANPGVYNHRKSKYETFRFL